MHIMLFLNNKKNSIRLLLASLVVLIIYNFLVRHFVLPLQLLDGRHLWSRFALSNIFYDTLICE